MLRLFHKLGKGLPFHRAAPENIWGLQSGDTPSPFRGLWWWFAWGMLWMVRTDTKIGKQQLLAAGMLASAVWFNGYEYRVDVFQGLGVVRL